MIETKETSITVRVPTYMKDFVTKKAKEAGMATGEFLRCMMFYDMLTDYSPYGYKKLSRLKDAYEVCGGSIPDSLIGEIIGGAKDKKEMAIEGILLAGIKKKAFDPVKKTSAITLGDMVDSVIAPPRKEEPVDVQEDTPKEVDKEEQTTPAPVPEPVEPKHKPKKPKMGNTMSMI